MEIHEAVWAHMKMLITIYASCNLDMSQGIEIAHKIRLNHHDRPTTYLNADDRKVMM